MTRTILITGGSGQVGTELMRSPRPPGWHIEAPGRGDLDLEDAAAIERVIASKPWAAVINAGAYTAVDRAEQDHAAAWRINAVAPAVIAAATSRAGIPIVHVSTDYVFNGQKSEPWDVDDPVGPLSVYGASKSGGEQAVRTGNAAHAIVRTAWVFSAHGANFVKTMLRLGADRPLLRVVDDQRGSPTAAGDLAHALLVIATRMASDREAPKGTYHFSNAGACSWADFAQEIFRQAAARDGTTKPTVERIATSDYPTPATRPANSRLSCSAITQDYDIVPRPWQQALGDVLDEMLGKAKQ